MRNTPLPWTVRETDTDPVTPEGQPGGIEIRNEKEHCTVARMRWCDIGNNAGAIEAARNDARLIVERTAAFEPGGVVAELVEACRDSVDVHEGTYDSGLRHDEVTRGALAKLRSALARYEEINR